MVSHFDHQRAGQTVGSKLRAARLARKLTQSQLARPDFSVSYVSAIERDQIQPSLRALEIFAQRLGITSTDLLSKTTAHTKEGLSERVPAHENKQEIELDLLEAQLLLLQGDNRKALRILKSLSSVSLKSYQQLRQCYLLGVALYYEGLYQESESVFREAYEQVTHENDYFTRHILNMLGLVYVSMHNHAHGFEYQLSNVVQHEKENEPWDAFFGAEIYLNLGVHYHDLNKIDDAINMFRKALAETNEVFSTEHLTRMYWHMSTSLAETQQYFLAMLYACKTLELLVQDNYHSLRSEIYHYLAQAMLQKDGQEALLILEQFRHAASSENDTLALASITAAIAELLLKRGEREKAYEYAQRACELAEEHGDSMITATIFITSGSIAYAQAQYQVGDKLFSTGLEMIERLKNYREYAGKCALYAQMLEDRGLPKEALKYYRKAYESGLEIA